MWVGFRLHYNLHIHLIDLLTLPLMMHLFTYLMPLKGGLLFQMLYSKSKYQLDLSKGFSLGITVFLISVFLTVVLGLGIALNMQPVPEVLTSALFILGLGIVIFLVVLPFVPDEPKKAQGFAGRFLDFLINVRCQLAGQIKNIPLVFGLLSSTLFSIFMQSLWYWKSAHMIGVFAPFASIVLMVLFLRIFLLVRLLPGNLGIQELAIGLVFSVTGFDLDQGLIVALLIRVVSVFLTAVIGLIGLYSNLKYFNADSISGLIRNVVGGKG